MARTPKSPAPEPLVECTTTFSSEWVEQNALDEFPLFGTVKRGVRQFPKWFAKATAHGEPRGEPA